MEIILLMNYCKKEGDWKRLFSYQNNRKWFRL